MTAQKTKINAYFNVLVRNPILKVSIFVVGVISAFMIDFGVQKFLLSYFPEYYENDAQEIIQSQKQHFDEIKNSINTLRADLTTQEGAEAVRNLERLITKANRDNELLTLTLGAIKQENKALRDHLVQQKGLDAATDLRLHHARAIKIGDFVISANKINYQNSVLIRLSSSEGNKSERLSVGESVNFRKTDVEECSLGFMGEPVQGVFDFSLNCA